MYCSDFIVVPSLFTVEADSRTYEAKFEGEVTMGCRFPTATSPTSDLTVIWHRIVHGSSLEVYRLNNGLENLASQDPGYRGRVRLLTEELDRGRAMLQVTRLRINDSGTYQCLVQMETADFKKMSLSVKAPYKDVTKTIQKSTEGDEVRLICRSEGHPLLSVTWEDGNLQKLNSSTAVVITPDQLFQVTSQIQVRTSDKNNYTCSFTGDGPSAMFRIPDDMPVPRSRNDALMISFIILMAVVVIVSAVLGWQRKKGSRGRATQSIRNVVDSEQYHGTTATTVLHREDVENLREFLKDHYRFCLHKEVGHHSDSFCQEKLLQGLQNNEGQPVNIQTLLPKAGETLLLEGPPGSGKTTVAHILISSWTEGSTRALSNLLELNSLDLLLLVDCGNATGHLFQEIMTQLSLREKISTEDNLRTVLSRSKEVFLVLDGYKEGNQVLDKSLITFLREEQECRVLVTACPGNCPKLKERVGARGVLKLHL
ncbi:butyrophilin subfamily 3 member A3 [Polymixia lowei]